MFGREPAVIAAAIAAVIQGVLILLHNDAASPPLAGAEVWLTPVITLIAGLFTRHKVVPVQKLEDNGINHKALS